MMTMMMSPTMMTRPCLSTTSVGNHHHHHSYDEAKKVHLEESSPYLEYCSVPNVNVNAGTTDAAITRHLEQQQYHGGNNLMIDLQQPSQPSQPS